MFLQFICDRKWHTLVFKGSFDNSGVLNTSNMLTPIVYAYTVFIPLYTSSIVRSCHNCNFLLIFGLLVYHMLDMLPSLYFCMACHATWAGTSTFISFIYLFVFTLHVIIQNLILIRGVLGPKESNIFFLQGSAGFLRLPIPCFRCQQAAKRKVPWFVC